MTVNGVNKSKLQQNNTEKIILNYNIAINGFFKDRVNIVFGDGKLVVNINKSNGRDDFFNKSDKVIVNFSSPDFTEVEKAQKILSRIKRSVPAVNSDLKNIISYLDKFILDNQIDVELEMSDFQADELLKKLSINIDRLTTVSLLVDSGKVIDRSGPFLESSDRRLQEILLADRKKNSLYNSLFYRDLSEIGRIQGFKLKETSAFTPFIEDVYISGVNQELYVAGANRINLNLYHAYKNEFGEDDSYYFDAGHVEYGFGSYPKTMYEVSKNTKNAGVNSKKLNFGIDGGNVLTAINKSGEKIVIIGEDVLFTNMKRGETTDDIKHMIAEQLDVNPNQIVAIPQPGTHIDMYLRPLNNGKFLLHDYNLTHRVLQTIKIMNADILTASQKKDIDSFIEYSFAMSDRHQRDIVRVRNALVKAGFDVTSVPGRIETSNKSVKHRANFMNGVTGTGNKGKYYITNGTDIPFVKELYAAILKKLGIDHVYFVGRNDSKTSFRPSEESLIKYYGGIDCRTIEIPPLNK